MDSGTTANPATILSEQALEAFDAINGPQRGFRPAHAKGILLAGVFTPSPQAISVTRAPHFVRSSTPITVRFSDFAGIPSVADNDPNASPRGMAVRFHLADHVHTDIISHSVDGFPTRTAEEFVAFLGAIHTSGPGVSKPSPLEKFLAAHPSALEFVQVPKPMPASFTTLPFYAVNAYKFTTGNGVSQYGRYSIRPAGHSEYLDSSFEGKAPPNFLFDEIDARLRKGFARMSIVVQLAAEEDIVDDSTIHWPASRPEVTLGTLELRSVLPNSTEEQRHIIFDPIPRVDGIDPSDDPLLEARANLYLMSGHRRRGAAQR